MYKEDVVGLLSDISGMVEEHGLSSSITDILNNVNIMMEGMTNAKNSSDISQVPSKYKKKLDFIKCSKYWITKDGRVWSGYKHDWLAPHLSDSGHLRLTLRNNSNKKQNFRLHRLLALSFIDVPEYLQGIPVSDLNVHHLDENKLNNNIINDRSRMLKCNLEWILHSTHVKGHHTSGTIKKGKLYKLLGLKPSDDIALKYKTGEKFGKALLKKVSHTAAMRIVDSPPKIFSEKTCKLFNETHKFLETYIPGQEFNS